MADAKLELLADSSQIRTAKSDLEALNATGANVERTQKGMQSAVKQTGVNLGNFSRKAGAAGIQIQQFTGQVSTGTNGLVALSQQAADLGIVLGAPLIGVFASLGATALLMAQDTEEAASASDRLKDSLEGLDSIVVTSESGIKELSEEIRKLAEYSDQAARAKITLGLIQAREAAEAAADSISESLSTLDAGFGFSGISDFVDAINSTNTAVSSGATYTEGFKETARELGEEFGLVGSEAQALGADIIKLIAKVQRNPSPDSFEELNQALLNAQASAPKASDSINRLIGETQEFFSKARTAAETTEFLKQNLDSITGSFEGSADKSESAAKSTANLTTNLQAQIIALESGAQAAEVYAATQAAIANGTQEQLPQVIELINRKYELKRAQEAAADSAKAEIEQQKEYESVLDSIFKNQERIEAQKEREAAQSQASYEGLRQQIILQQAQLQLDSDQYELRRNLLALGDGASQSQIAEITALTQQMQRLRFESELMGSTLSESFRDIGVSAIDDMSESLAEVAVNGGDVEDAMKGIASTILTDMVTALIRYGIVSAAQALGVTTAWAPAAATTSIASFGAAPASGLAAATAAVPAITALFGRATGGSVYDNNSYIVGERGPELFTPNSSGGGRITPFNQLMNQAGGTQTIQDNSTIQFNVTGVYQTGEEMLYANRDIIYNLVKQAKRREGVKF